MGMFNFVLDSIKGELFDFKVKRRVFVASTVYLYSKFWHSQKWHSMRGPSAKMKNSFGFEFVLVIHSSDKKLGSIRAF